MSWLEFSSLLSGLMPDTPLGQIVSIRAEKDAKRIKAYTKEQRDIRNQWIIRRNKKMKENPEAYSKWAKEFQQMCKDIFK